MAMYILHKPGVNLIGAVTRDTFTVVYMWPDFPEVIFLIC